MNLTNGLNMWEMTHICGKVFEKRLKCAGNDVELWEMT